MAKSKMKIKNKATNKEFEVTDREWEAIAQNPEVVALYVVIDPGTPKDEIITTTTKP